MPGQNFDPRDLINAWNTHSADKVVEHYADDAELVAPDSKETLRGKDAIRQNIQGWMKGFPDVTGDIETTVHSGQNVALLVHFSGTHKGEMELAPGAKLAPTNKKVETPVGMFLTLDQNGKITKEVDVMDIAAMVRQLGVPPEKLGAIMGGQSGSQGQRPQTR